MLPATGTLRQRPRAPWGTLVSGFVGVPWQPENADNASICGWTHGGSESKTPRVESLQCNRAFHEQALLLYSRPRNSKYAMMSPSPKTETRNEASILSVLRRLCRSCCTAQLPNLVTNPFEVRQADAGKAGLDDEVIMILVTP